MNQQAAATGDHERYSRRLSDKIQAAFEHACDEGELIAASELLAVLENVLLSNPLRPERWWRRFWRCMSGCGICGCPAAVRLRPSRRRFWASKIAVCGVWVSLKYKFWRRLRFFFAAWRNCAQILPDDRSDTVERCARRHAVGGGSQRRQDAAYRRDFPESDGGAGGLPVAGTAGGGLCRLFNARAAAGAALQRDGD